LRSGSKQYPVVLVGRV